MRTKSWMKPETSFRFDGIGIGYIKESCLYTGILIKPLKTLLKKEFSVRLSLQPLMLKPVYYNYIIEN